MNESNAVQRRVDTAASWYNSREDFDRCLIEFSWLKMKERVQGESVLELGSADGLMTQELVKHFKKVVVVEGAAKNVTQLKKQLPEVEVHHTLFEDFSTTEQFDNIIAARVLEHLDDPVSVLERFKEYLSPQGVLHVIVPNAESFNRKLGLAMGLIEELNELTERDQHAGHVRVYRRDELVQHIRAAGLEIVELTGTFLKLLSNSQMMEWDPEILLGLYHLSDELPQYCTEIYARCRV